jgi:hypothetical protein
MDSLYALSMTRFETPCIRYRDCNTTLSESVKLSLARTLVQFWKKANANGLKHTNPFLNKSLVPEYNSYQPLFARRRAIQSPARQIWSLTTPPHTTYLALATSWW